MKKPYRFINVIFTLFSLLILISCNTNKDPATIAYTLEEKDLIPEGITFDPVTNQFFVSSIYKEKVVVISKAGVVSDFIPSGRDSIMETLGLKVDPEARRLWVVSNKKTDIVNYSFVHIYDIDSKRLIKKLLLADTTAHLFNDLALNSMGDAFITDSYSASIYMVKSSLDKIEPFAGPDSLLLWVNGIVVSPDDKILYSAAGAGISVINISTKEIKRIGDKDSSGTSGIDGLVFYKKSLIGIVNSRETESEMFVARYELGPDLMEIQERTIIDKGNALFNLPTTCTLSGQELYVLGNTSLRLYFQDKANEKGLFMNPLILKYKLEK